MDINKELEIETIENVGRVLDNIFSEETNQDSKDFFQGEIEQINNNNNNQNFIKYPNVKSAPKLFVNDQLFVQSEAKDQLNQPAKFGAQNGSQPFFSISDDNSKQFSNIGNQDSIDIKTYYNLKGTFYELITSQNGSRFMQKVYLNTETSILEKIFIELIPKIPQLMIDPYANYFCQKFFSVLNSVHKIKFLNSLIPEAEKISNSKIGTYPIQSVIEQLKTDAEQNIILSAIQGKVLSLCQNPQGVHVIEKIIVCFKENLIDEIYTVIITNFIQLSTNSTGLFVCKKLISQAKNLGHLLQIREVICNNSTMLIHNQYGNYTIQVAIESWPIEFSQPLIRSLFPNFITLSCQKYASNVIEKCLEKSQEKLLSEFIDEIGKNSSIVTLITNSYGNFVLQTALKLSKGKDKTRLLNYIKKCLEKINDKKLLKKWKGIISISSHLTCQNMGLSNQLNNSYENPGGNRPLRRSFNSSDKLNQSSSSNKSEYSFKSSGEIEYNSKNLYMFNSFFVNPNSNCNSPRSPIHFSSKCLPTFSMGVANQNNPFINPPLQNFNHKPRSGYINYNINFE